MEKVWETIKKIGIVVTTALSAVAVLLIGRDTKKVRGCDVDGGASLDSEFGTLTEEKIEGKCNEKRNEALERIGNTDARVLSENYGTVCDAITDGKIRFQNRCGKLD